ncbi:hypothetical protein I203_108137 [Kwoniella mangroviensis CBS 8507]|uniref:hypothetical protein n=1 Tax=Kwoniella mangroviensis CBS 8507 TaxID=1296122 RepID=UPI00080D42CF|nr:uncharacterized protein I203_05030 [Kwoniella mangroviensis CBS 8507]OCF66008.1 hypothetical protein I203_05030 [Kwoniella mangroviensis CBS 8507]
MRIQDLFIHSEDEPDSQTELAKTIGQDDMEGPPSFMPIFTKNNLRMLYQKFPTPSLRFMPRNTSPIQATFATGPNLIPLCRRPPRLFGNPTSVDSNIHPQRLPFFAPSIIISPRPPYDHQNSPHCQNRSDTNSRSISTGSLINQGWTTYRYPQGRFGSPQKSTGKKYSSHAQGYLKIPLTREEVLVNERIAQCRAAIKRHMVLRSYLIFRKKGPVPIDPTFLANHPS